MNEAKKKLFFTLLVLSSLSLFAGENRADVVYGSDDRQFWTPPIAEQATGDIASSKDLGSGVAIRLNRYRMFWDEANQTWSTFARVASQQFGLCRDEKFANSLVVGDCTGFLVAPNIIATAGHCFKPHNGLEHECAKHAWAFGFNQALAEKSENSDNRVSFDKAQVYHCKEILVVEDTYENNKLKVGLPANTPDLDYALVLLDRKVDKRQQVMSLKKTVVGEQMIGREMEILGHGLGLPLTYAEGFVDKVLPNQQAASILVTTLDSFGGNSGSPVFFKGESEVVGLLFNGEDDFVRDEELGCKRSKVCSEDELTCQGEKIQSIQPIRDYINLNIQ